MLRYHTPTLVKVLCIVFFHSCVSKKCEVVDKLTTSICPYVFVTAQRAHFWPFTSLHMLRFFFPVIQVLFFLRIGMSLTYHVISAHLQLFGLYFCAHLCNCSTCFLQMEIFSRCSTCSWSILTIFTRLYTMGKGIPFGGNIEFQLYSKNSMVLANILYDTGETSTF